MYPGKEPDAEPGGDSSGYINLENALDISPHKVAYFTVNSPPEKTPGCKR
jgi:hypothetical protein